MISSKTIDYIKKTYLQEEFILNPTCYFYDLSIIKENINKLQKNSPTNISLYYAMKANSNSNIMDFISHNSFVKGIEIASSGELKIASKYYNSNSLIFTGPGKTEYELEQAIKSGIRLINIESVVEAIRINNIATRLKIEKVDILIRINLNYSIEEAFEHMSGRSTKMGIDENEYISSFKIISKLDRICIKGIHVFAASGVLDYKALIKSNKYIFELVKKIEKETQKISIIDLGGGIGIDYTNLNREFDVEKYFLYLDKLVKEYGYSDKEIIMELGTYIVGNAGYYTAKIIDIKKTKGYKHIIVAGGVNHMGLPLEMRRKHPVEILQMNSLKLYDEQPNVEKEKADISGPLCMVTDKLCWDEYIEKAEIGDIVIFKQSGAYCYGEGMHEFLSHMYPKELIIPNTER